MTAFKKTLAAIATTAALCTAGGAHATLTNWYLDTNGAAAGGVINVSDYLDLNGKAFININSTPSPTYTFNEAANFLTILADGGSFLPNALRSEFIATGTGNTTTGKLSFDTGSVLKVFDSSNNQIGTFSLYYGDGQIKTGTVLPNGTFSLIFRATNLSAGYFFDSAMNDLSTQVATGLTFGFATTNAIFPTYPTAADKARLANTYNTAFGSSLTAGDIVDTAMTLVIANNGQFRLQVPEPTSMVLASLGLSGLAALRRRKPA